MKKIQSVAVKPIGDQKKTKDADEAFLDSIIK